jgi:hypothetical protein
MNTPETHPLSDQILASRALYDAELIQGGASFRNGLLIPSVVQISNMNEVVNEVADPAEEELNKQVLNEQITELTAPYVHLFDKHIPPASRYERGRMAPSNETFGPIPEWSYVRSVDGKDVEYTFSGMYTAGKEQNSLMNMSVITYCKRDKYIRTPNVHFGAENDQINKVQLSTYGWDHGLAEAVISPEDKPTQLSRFLHKSMPSGCIDIDISELGTTLSLGIPNRAGRRIQDSFIYRYYPTHNEFIYSDQSTSPKMDNMPESMSVPDFLTILQETLNIVKIANNAAETSL